MHKNNQDKRISKRHEPTITNIGQVLSSNTKHENKKQKHKLCKSTNMNYK
jgi:hypothetical protein